MLTKHTLQSIQAGTEEELYSKVTDVALYIATGGYLDSANTLLSALWKYKMPHDRSTWLPDIAFMVLWDASGNYPDFIPFELDNIDSIEKNMRGYIATDNWPYEMPDVSWQKLSGQDLLRNALITARLVKGGSGRYAGPANFLSPESGDSPDFSELMAKVGGYIESVSVQPSDSLPSASDETEALAMLEKMVTEGYFNFHGLVLGAELAARHGQRETAVRFAKLFVERSVQSGMGVGFPPITVCRHVAPLLLEGMVATELGISRTVVEKYLVDILKVLDKRMMQGRSLAFGDLSWKELIQEISQAALRIEDIETYNDIERSVQWIGFEGAESKEIMLSEERLKLRLPEDYKQFLATTNGIRKFPLNNPALLPVERIDYLKDILEPYFFDIIGCCYPEGGDEKMYLENLTNAILISAYPDEQLVWLMPEDKERATWQTWFYASWLPGERIFPSFRFYVEEQLAQMGAYDVTGSSKGSEIE
jgi:hypothetical protein